MGDGPIIGPWMNALKIKAYMQGLQDQQEEREYRRESYKLNLEQMRRDRVMQDLNTALTLHQIGAMPVQPGEDKVEGALTSAMGPTTPESTRERITVPTQAGNKEYRLPSREDTMKQRLQEGEIASRIKFGEGFSSEMGKKEADRAVDPMTDVTLEGETYGQVPASKVVDTKLRIYQRLHPNMHITASPDDDGNMHFFGTNTQTGERKDLGTEKGAARTKEPPATELENYTSAEVDAEEERLKAGKYKSQLDDAVNQNAVLDRMHKEAVENVKQAAKRRALQGRVAERKAASTAQKAYPTSESKLAEIKRVARMGPIDAEKVPAAAKHLGMTPEEFSRAWHSAGGRINPPKKPGVGADSM